MKKNKEISLEQAQELWNVSDIKAKERLHQMIKKGFLVETDTQQSYSSFKTFKRGPVAC